MDTQNSSFSVKREEINGQSVFQITLVGKKEDWEPEFQALVDSEFKDELKDRVVQIADGLPDTLEKPATLEVKTGEPTIPEDAIISIGQIPEVLKDTDLPAVYLTKIVEGKPREVVLLGETHVATKDESEAASRIIPFFDQLGVEGIDVSQCFEGRVFFWVFYKVFFPIINFFSFRKKRSGKHESSIAQASRFTTKVVHLEEGWQPTIRLRLFFITFTAYVIYWLFSTGKGGVEVAQSDGAGGVAVYVAAIALGFFLAGTKFLGKPISYLFQLLLRYVFGVTGSRDRNMAKNLVEALREDDTVKTVLVCTGSAHTPRIAKILQKKYGFERQSFPAV